MLWGLLELARSFTRGVDEVDVEERWMDSILTEVKTNPSYCPSNLKQQQINPPRRGSKNTNLVPCNMAFLFLTFYYNSKLELPFYKTLT